MLARKILVAEAKCPKCACKLEIGKALVGKNPSKCWGTPEKYILEIVFKCPTCGLSIEKKE
jgi:hypothetical protein